MVRVKNRYLLVNILYPEDQPYPLATRAQRTPTKNALDAVSFRSPAPKHIEAHSLLSEIKKQIALLFGDYGAGATSGGLAMKYFSAATSTFIIRCPRASFRLVWAALTLMSHLPAARNDQKPPQPCVYRVIRVSGTIRKSEDKLMAMDKRLIQLAHAEGETDGGGLDVLQGLLGAPANELHEGDLGLGLDGGTESEAGDLMDED